MLLTNHTLTGVLLSFYINNPLVLAPVGFVSHFVMDSIPHLGHPKLDFKHKEHLGARLFAAGDCLASLSILIGAIIIWPDRWWIIAIGAFFTTLPDLLYIPRYLLDWQFWHSVFELHALVQRDRETSPGMITEGLWATMILYFLKNMR